MPETLSLLARDSYTVVTPIFQGPLDLLVQLIERAELDITRLALAQVTDQYLSHLRQVEHQAPEEVSYFLVVAARLLQIKSEALLPRPPVREPGEEDPGEALIRQLKIYKQFKQVVEWLDQRQQTGLRCYLRLASPPKVETHLDLSGVTVEDLWHLAQELLQNVQPQEKLNDVYSPPKITVREKVRLIVEHIKHRGKTTFKTLVSRAHSRLEIVVTFLAMLELVKLSRLEVRQEHLFGEIELQPTEQWDNGINGIDLEFGE